MIKSKKGRWYIKQGESVQGPFPNKLIGTYLILGRISPWGVPASFTTSGTMAG